MSQVKGASEARRRELILRALLELMRFDPAVDDSADIDALVKEKVAAFARPLTMKRRSSSTSKLSGRTR